MQASRPSAGSRRARLAAAGGIGLALFATLVLDGCQRAAEPPPPPPPPEVTVLQVQPRPVTLLEDYVGQAEALQTVEVRAQVQGLLERQEFQDGARVRKGELLFSIDRRPFEVAVDRARANLAQAQASLVNSQQTLARAQRLIADHAVSQADLEAATARQAADEATVEADRAALRDAELNLEYTQISSPLDGIASRSQVKPGALVSVAQTLLTTVYAVDPILVDFAVSEQRMPEFARARQAGAGRGLGFRLQLADGSDYPFPGRLDFVDAAVDPRTDTLAVRIAVPNPAAVLRPGQYARVIVGAPSTAPVIVVPQRAVSEQQGLKSVFVVGDDGRAAARQITASRRLGADWVVEAGLAAGDRVVVEGVQKVSPGAAVKAVVQAAPAAGAKP